MKSLSKVFKSDYVQIGTPKPVKNTAPIIKKPAPVHSGEEDKKLSEELLKESETIANNMIEDAKQMYLNIIEEANIEAKRILEEANIEAVRHIQEEFEKGFNEGHMAGYKESKLEAQAIIDDAADIRLYLDTRREQMYQEVEEQVVELILDITKKVIGQELVQNQDAILSLIKQALDKCAFKNKLLLRVSAEDFDYVSENKDRILMMIEGISDLEIFSDLSLNRGGCIIETSSGEVNSSVDIQINELEKMFAFMIRNE